MPVTNGYVTTDELREHLADPDKLPQALLDRAVSAASRAIDRYCDRRFWLDETASTRIYTPAHGHVAFVDDIGSLTDLAIGLGSDGVTFPTILAADTDYMLSPKVYDDFDAYAFEEIHLLGGRRFYDCSRYLTNGTLSVTARWGWSAVPDEIAQACLIKAAALFKRKDAVYGVAGFNEFGAVRIGSQDVDVVQLLSPFTKLAFA